MQQQLNYVVPPRLAIAAGATTPDPGASGVVVDSTTTNSLLRWSGSNWLPLYDITVLSAAPGTNQQNWSPGVLGANTRISAALTGNGWLGGIVAGYEGQQIAIQNSSTDSLLVLVDQDAASAAANRFKLLGDHVEVYPGQIVQLVYSAGLSAWLQVSDVFRADGVSIGRIFPGAATVPVTSGSIAQTSTPTVSTIEPVNTPTNSFDELACFQVTSATASGSADVRSNTVRWRKSATSGRGGVAAKGTLRITALGATGSAGAMLCNTTAAITAQIRNTNNSIGFGAHGGETTLRFWTRDGTTTNAIDLGANFPVPSATAAYAFWIFGVPNTASYGYMIRRLDSDQRAQGSQSVNAPAATVAMCPRLQVTVGATATASTAQANYLQIQNLRV